MATQLQTQRDGLLNLVTYLEKRKGELAAALPQHLGIERMFRIWLTEFRRSPKLGQCDPASVYSALLTASQLGLEIGVGNNAWLVPYGTECQLLVGYEGLLALVERTDKVAAVWTGIVYEGDEWDLSEGTEPKITHKPKPSMQRRGEGEIVGVYAVAKKTNGTVVFRWLWRWQVDDIRTRSRSKSGPWFTDYPSMAVKTAIRQLCKILPKSPELAKALQLDDEAELGLSSAATMAGALDTTFTDDASEAPPANGTSAAPVTPSAPAAKEAPATNGDAPESDEATAEQHRFQALAGKLGYGIAEISNLMHSVGGDMDGACAEMERLLRIQRATEEAEPAASPALTVHRTKPAAVPRAAAATRQGSLPGGGF